MNPQRILAALLCIALCGHTFAQAQDMDTELSSLAEKLATPIKDKAKKKVAVIDFTDLQGGSSELGKYIAEELTVDLVMGKREFSVMDRANLKKILAEHKLTATGLIDPENAKKLGMFAGLDALILGTITPKNQTISLTAKIIATDTAEIVGAAKATFKTDETVQNLLSKPAAETPVIGGGEEKKAEEKAIVKSFGDLRVELPPLTIVSGANYLVSMTLSNKNPKASIWVAVNAEQSNMLKGHVVDPNGNEFPSYGGNTCSGIAYASYFKDPYQTRDEFSPATEIRPGDSVSATVRFLSMGGNSPTAGICNLQLELLIGHNFNSRGSSVSSQNLSTKIKAE